MHYAVYKLEFTTALHIGNDSGSATLPSAEMTIHSDTLFFGTLHRGYSGEEMHCYNNYMSCPKRQIILSDSFHTEGVLYTQAYFEG